MKKVYQKVIDSQKGDCMQAVVASLFELELNEVPKFIEEPENRWFPVMHKFFFERGYDYHGSIQNKNYNRLMNPQLECFTPINWNSKRIMSKKSLYKLSGINGFFFASVFSPKYFNWDKQTTHAVVIDKNYNIVHDPSPAYKNIKKYPLTSLLGYNGIIDVFLFQKM